MSVLEVRDLSIRFGGLQALQDVNLEVNEYEIVGLIGVSFVILGAAMIVVQSQREDRALFAVLDFILTETPVKAAEDFLSFGNPNVVQFFPQFIGALGLLLTLTKYRGGIGEQIRPLTQWLAGKPFSIHGDADSGPAAVEGSSVRA